MAVKLERNMTTRKIAITQVVNRLNLMIEKGLTRMDCIDALKAAKYSDDTIIFLLDLIQADK